MSGGESGSRRAVDSPRTLVLSCPNLRDGVPSPVSNRGGRALVTTTDEHQPAAVNGSKPYSATMIRDMPDGDRPRERLRNLGASALSNAELVAILLRTGSKGENVLNMANRLLASLGGLRGLGRIQYSELCEVHGVSDAKACQVLAALEFGRRLHAVTPEDRPTIATAEDVVNVVGSDMGMLDREELRVLLLSTKNHVLGAETVYKGNVSSSLVRVAEVLSPAIRRNCPSLIMVHNHPSGDPSPSPDDVLVTRKVARAAEMMDLQLLDHVVIGGSSSVSMKNKGLGFGPGG